MQYYRQSTLKSIISFLWYHIKPYKWYYMIMLLAPIFCSFMPFITNYATKLFIDILNKEQFSYQELYLPIFFFFTSYLLISIMWRISNIVEYKSEPYVRTSIILHAYDYLQNHDYSFFQKNFTGAITSKIKSLLDGYESIWEEMHAGLLQDIMSIIINLISLFFVHALLGCFIFSWSIVFVITTYFLSKRIYTLAFISKESEHNIMGKVADRLMNIFSILAFSAKRKEFHKLKSEMHQEFIPNQIALNKYQFCVYLVLSILELIMILTMLFVIVSLRKRNLITIGNFTFIFGTVISMIPTVWSINLRMPYFFLAMGDFKSALSVLYTKQSSINTTSPKKALRITSPSITFSGVSFGYRSETKILKGIDLQIQPGENVGLVGYSGAGKSTLIQLLLRYYSPQEGIIKIDQQNIGEVDLDSLRDHITLIPQNSILFHRSILENIQFANPNATYEDIIKVAKQTHIHSFIKKLSKKYSANIGEQGSSLSIGQRQRIHIARALLKDTPIVILDEATSALDSLTEKYIQESLKVLLADKTKTIIVIAHKLFTLKNLDKIFVMNRGKIKEVGKHEELIQQPNSIYKNLWDLQCI